MNANEETLDEFISELKKYHAIKFIVPDQEQNNYKLLIKFITDNGLEHDKRTILADFKARIKQEY